MNAYELADELEKFESFNGDIFFGTCAITLRQQADRIAGLRETYEMYMDYQNELKAEIEVLKSHSVKHLSDEKINELYEMWQALSGDPVKLYQLFKIEEAKA